MCAIRGAGMFLLAAWLMSVPALAQSSSLREKIFANPVAEFNNAVRVVAASARNYPRTRGGEIAIDWCNYNSTQPTTPSSNTLNTSFINACI
jgi:hypothetical protein